ncbi:hypothetical protein B0H10DRAFT_1924817 [Mycena sp. CBHHK59/15]|nr:hypothetical protein B0H10DRAFT_1924817 [Mycena sp. CBHHK59/15]
MGVAPITVDNLASELASQGIPESRIEEEAIKLHSLFDEQISKNGGHIARIGAKPEDTAKDDDVILFDIPGTHYTVRVFPGETGPSTGMWYLDFYDLMRREPVNTPQGFNIYLVGPPELLAGPGPLISMERAYGVPQKDIRPGQEKFGLPERAWCKLERPGREPFFFRMPSRNEPVFANPRPFRFAGPPQQPTPPRVGPLGLIAPCPPIDIEFGFRDDDEGQ